MLNQGWWGKEQLPCTLVKDGTYYYTEVAFHPEKCRSTLSTKGKVEFRYGYMELDYILDLRKFEGYTNHALVLWSAPRNDAMLRYGIPLNTKENYLRYAGNYELDLLEYVPVRGSEFQHFYTLYDGLARLPVSAQIPATADARIRCFCSNFSQKCRIDQTHPKADLSVCNLKEDDAKKIVRITKGIEWAPDGYTYYIKIHDTSYPQGFTTDSLSSFRPFQIVPTRLQDGTYGYGPSSGVSKTGRYASNFRDNKSKLQSFTRRTWSVSHVPAYIDIYAWGSNTTAEIQSYVRINYIRLYKPENNYKAISPIYN